MEKSSRFSILIASYSVLLTVSFVLCPHIIADMEGVRVLETPPDGLVIQYQMPELKVDARTVDGQTFQMLSFKGCGFTYEAGKPQVPIKVLSLGIPDVSEPDVSVLNTESSLQTGYRLYPVESQVIHREPGTSSHDGIQDTLSPGVRYTAGTEFVMDESFYGTQTLYPVDLAEIEPVGYVRQQRMARLELHPIQYNPATGQLRIYKTLEIKVTFHISAGLAPSRLPAIQDPEAGTPGVFEDLYQDMMLNYDQARNWRKPRHRETASPAMAPGLSTATSPNPVEQGTWYKITVDNNGIYKLDYNYLANAGIDPGGIDPRKIDLISSGERVPIYVEGYDDGRFDLDDYIEFYGVKADSLYTNENVYWLSWGRQGAQSWIIPVKDGTPKASDLKAPVAFWTTEHWEQDVLYDPLKEVTSETADHLFWTEMRGQDPKGSVKENMFLELPYRAGGMNTIFKLRVCFQGITYARGASNHKIEIILNNETVAIAEWEGQTEYITEVVLPHESLRRFNHFWLHCLDENDTYNKVMNDPRYTGPEWDVYLNWVEIDYWREFRAESNRLEFSTETLPPTTKVAQYSVSEFSGPEIEVFQVDRTGAVAKIINPLTKGDGTSYTATFEDRVTQPTRYVVINAALSLHPAGIVKDNPSILHDPANRADYIMITHRNFRKSTERLADFRRSQGLGVIVVDVNDIYDEFSYGIFDPKSIKRFLRYAYFNWDKIPTYVLLMGDAHWDYKYVMNQYYVKYETYPRIYVPTYHAPSMPYGESALDHRFVTVSGDDILPDMLIGRIPVESTEEANNAVDKIIKYESSPYRGQWQSRILLVADDEKSKSGDEVFENSRVDLANNIIPVGYEVIEAYLRRIREPYLVEKVILTEMNKGAVITEYAGHGGIHHWAHEGIFDLDSAERLQNYNKYSFIITTTCDNGYFDNPMSKCIMEVFLGQQGRGAVACLSATRLTFGQGNRAFDEMLYPRMFAEKPPILGKVIAESKIDFINLGMSSWLGSAEQYTLFGDPATKLALPELDIECKLSRIVVDSERELVLKPGKVKRLKLNLTTGKEELVTDTGFNAEMKISVVYPNNRDDISSNNIDSHNKAINIWKGEYSETLLPIPEEAISGEGRLRCFANSGSDSAVGGVLFSVTRPIIESFFCKIIREETLRVYAGVVDNLGSVGIKSVICRWHDSETWQWHTANMKLGEAPPDPPEIEGRWYTIEKDIPLSKPGTYIDYEIHVQDTEGNAEVISPLDRIRVPIGVNLAVSRTGPSMLPAITYSYSLDKGAWMLLASVENNGGKLVREPIAVYFFDGNPDRNRDNVVDAQVETLGYFIVEYVDIEAGAVPAPGQWRPGEGVVQVADISIQLEKPLYSGSHHIFVWVNPKTGIVHQIPDIRTVEDADRADDKAARLFQINEFVVGKDNESTSAQSLDGTLTMLIPPDSVDETVMSITKLTPPESEWKQPDLTLAPIPEQGLDGGAFKFQLASGVTSLRKEAQISIRFDATALWKMAKEIKGLADKYNSDLTATEREWIDLACQEEARKLGIFAWQEDIGVWQYVPSELVIRRQSLLENEELQPFLVEPYVTLPTSQNRSDVDLTSTDVVVDEIITPLGDWVIFFLNSNVYRVYLRREGINTYERLRLGSVGTTYYSDDIGLTLNLKRGSRDFEFGDVFTFKTYQDAAGIIKLANLSNHNMGDGAARVTILTPEDFHNISYTPGNWAAFFTSRNYYEIHSDGGYQVKDSLGYPIVGEVGKEILVPAIGVRVEIHEGRWQFQFGDKIVFKTLSTGMVRTQIDQLKTITLMHSNDVTPPDIQVWINRQIPRDGAVVAPRPDISLLLSDANGIDINSLSFLVSLNDRDFRPVPADEYMFSERIRSSGFITNVPIFYSPVLSIGKYRYRVDVTDFNGNSTRGDTGSYMEFMFLVEEQPDMNPPVINVTTAEGLTLVNHYVFNTGHPEFLADIEDDHALDPSTILLSLAYADEPLEPLEESEYEMTFSDDASRAKIIYKPHLMNGEYSIQIQAADTSSNTAYLSPPEEPLRFRVDETVDVGGVLNIPNPFPDTTVFCYSLTQPADRITIKIYTVRGRLVRTLVHDFPGWLYNETFWDGRDEDGNDLASGVYLFKFILSDADRKIEKIGKLAIVR